MTSSSKRVLPAVHLAPRSYKLGLPNGGNLDDESDPEVRLRHIELKHLAEIETLRSHYEIEKETAMAASRHEGYQQASQEAAQQLAAEQARWAGLLNQLAAARQEVFAVSETQLIELVLAAVDKIIAGRPERPEKIGDTLREAFNLLATKDKLTIICSPADAVYIRKLLTEHRNDFEDIARFSVREDPGIQPGGCLVETEWGTVDARVEKRLAVLKQIWSEAAHESQDSGEDS